MSRRISTKKRFPEHDFNYDNFLVSLLINRVLQRGKKCLSRRIIYRCFFLVETRTSQNPILLFEKAIRNIRPRVQLKAKQTGRTIFQVPSLLTKFRSIALAIRWLVESSKKRSGKAMSFKLANELIEASKGIGNAIKKKEEIHKMAESNRAFLDL